MATEFPREATDIVFVHGDGTEQRFAGSPKLAPGTRGLLLVNGDIDNAWPVKVAETPAPDDETQRFSVT